MSPARSPASLAAGLALAGFLIGGAIALSRSTPYRASTTLVVEVHGVPASPTAKDAVPTIAALARSNVVVENVADAMKLGASAVRSHLHASVVPGTALVRIGYDDSSDVRARQLAQEAASALQAVVGAHFGSRLSVSVADPLSSSRLGRPWLDGALIGALVGALLGVGWAAAAELRGRPAADRPARAPRPARPARPARVRRERARRAPADAPQPALRIVPPEPPRPSPAPVQAPAPPRETSGRVADLRRKLAAHRDEFDPDQIVSWEASLGALEAQSVDGELSPALESLALELFEPLLELDS